MENYKKICGRVSCIFTIFFSFVAIIFTIVMIYLVHLGKFVEKICSFHIIFSLNYLDLSLKIERIDDKIERLSDSKNSPNVMNNQNTEDCATKLGFYFQKTGKCYVQSYLKTNNWTEARTECKRLGGDLATIGDQSTQDFFLNISRKDVKNTYIGGERKSGVWSWADGTTWYGFANWQTGEPNDGDDVVVLINNSTFWYDGLKVGHYEGNYLCQY